jgi:predicted nucleic acid-binding protein
VDETRVEPAPHLPTQPAGGLGAPTVQRYVVDTGVFVRWFLDQEGYEHAREIQQRFVLAEISLITSDMARIELAHVLRQKGLLAGRLDRTTYLDAVRALDFSGVEIRNTDVDILSRAADWAIRLSLRIFDALFVDLAIQTGDTLLTSDARLARAVAGQVPVEILRPS